MKKFISFFFIVVSISYSFAAPKRDAGPRWRSKEFTFINKTPNEVKMFLYSIDNRINPAEYLFPTMLLRVVIPSNESRSVKLDKCIDMIAIATGPGGFFAGGINTVQAQWFRASTGIVLRKCSGVAEITKKDNKYRIKWIK